MKVKSLTNGAKEIGGRMVVLLFQVFKSFLDLPYDTSIKPFSMFSPNNNAFSPVLEWISI